MSGANQISHEIRELRCPSCGGSNIIKADVLGSSNHRDMFSTHGTDFYLKPAELDAGVVKVDRSSSNSIYSRTGDEDITIEQLLSVRIQKYFCKDCGLVTDRCSPQAFSELWENLIKYKYQPFKRYRNITGEWNPKYDVTVLHHKDDRSPVLDDFITSLRSNGMSVRHEDTNWNDIGFIESLEDKIYNPHKVWGCRMCVLIMDETLLKHADRSVSKKVNRLRFGLMEYAHTYSPIFKQWILPVSISIKYEELESRKLLDEQFLFRNLNENGTENVAREIAEHIRRTCKHRDEE